MSGLGFVLRCVAQLTAPREALSRRRVSECVVASRVWGLVEWVFKFVLVVRCVVDLNASWEARLGRRVLEWF